MEEVEETTGMLAIAAPALPSLVRCTTQATPGSLGLTMLRCNMKPGGKV
jgi:hypothetical protein